jgi:hypothetical protein
LTTPRWWRARLLACLLEICHPPNCACRRRP